MRCVEDRDRRPLRGVNAVMLCTCRSPRGIALTCPDSIRAEGYLFACGCDNVTGGLGLARRFLAQLRLVSAGTI